MNNALILASSVDFKKALEWKGLDTYSGEMIMSFITMIIIIILAFIIYFNFKGKDSTKPDKNKFITVMCMIVNWLEDYCEGLMGKKWRIFAGYDLCLLFYIFLSFFIAITGLPGPLTLLGNTACLGLCSLVLIHFTAAKANHWGYFKRYIDPAPIFLPINLLSMWAPLLSLSLRLFGNAISGFAIEIIIYYFLEMASDAVFGGVLATSPFPGPGGMFFAPVVMPFLHLYFDVFSGFIQAFIFISLTSLWVSQEDPEEEEEEQSSVKAETYAPVKAVVKS